MKKVLFFLLFFADLSIANSLKLEKGLYSTPSCDIAINISNYANKYTYELLGLPQNYRGDLIFEKETISFDKLQQQLNPDQPKSSKSNPDINGQLKGKNYFVFHNYGEVADPYMLFEKCDKQLEYHKIEDLKNIENDLKAKRNLDKYSLSFFATLQEYFPINNESLQIYNDIAYYLYQAEKYEVAISLLDDILHRYPDRIVAHLNIADALVANDAAEEAKMHYLTYIAQMMKTGKEKRIPKAILDKYPEELRIIQALVGTVDENFEILDIAKGDINQDKREDRAVVIAYVDRNKIETNLQFMKPSNINERPLLLYLGTRNGFKLHTETDQAIFPDDVPNCEDSFNGIEIKQKSLYITYHYWCSAGGWSQGEEQYQFLYRNNAMVLAGLESWDNSRATGEGKQISANFLTQKISIQKTIEFDKPQGKAVWKNIKLKEPILLQYFSVNHIQSLISSLDD